MVAKKEHLSREAMGTRDFTYKAGVTVDEAGLHELTVSAVARDKKYRMPEPSPEKRTFTADDMDGLEAQGRAFLEEWAAASPGSSNQVLCCSKVVQNALTRARVGLRREPVRKAGPPA